jgi:electron transfer flavoprotein alpha subunit
MIMSLLELPLLEKIFIPRLAGSLDAGMASEVTNFVMEGDNFNRNTPTFCW